MSILWLRQNKNHHNYYMSLFMKGEAKKHFVAGCRKRYGEKRSRKAKSDIIDDLMLYVGYKSRKHVIRVLNHTPEKRKRKPRGRHKERLKAFHESLDPIDLTSMVQQCRRAILHLLRQSQEIESE